MQHIAIIPDGNRRWATQNKLESLYGHKRGMETVKYAMNVCLKNGIKYLSFYTFSLENRLRSDLEKQYLFNLLADGFIQWLPELLKNEIKVRFVGDRQQFPASLMNVINQIETETQHLDKLHLSLLFFYGARAEMAYAVKALAKKVKDGLLKEEDIDEAAVSNALWTAGTPDPDLIIRTSGQIRMSNFMLYQAAYSEWMFLPYHWPDVTEERLQGCLDDFKTRQRNFGR